MKQAINILILITAMVFAACRKPATPKPYGYCRIAIPDTAYTPLDAQSLPYNFDISANAHVEYRDTVGWIDVVYPTLNAKIYCTYHRIRNNLRELSDDANGFIYKHAVMADAIPEQGYENPTQKVFGVYYDLKGNTASPLQIVLTDSTKHFFRAALYFYATPNQDSLAPVTEYMRHDMRRMVESFRWK